MAKPHPNRSNSGTPRQRETITLAGLTFNRDLARKAFTIISVAFILLAIGMNTFLARRQTHEQENSLSTLRESGRLKHDLDQVQQMMLDERGQLYTLISTRPFYKRTAYNFPMSALLELTGDARLGCRGREDCLSRLNELDEMMRKLGERSNALARRVDSRPGSVGLGDPALSEIDAYFYSVLEHVVDVRMEADATLDSVVSQSSSDAKWVSAALLASGLTAAALLLALMRWNARIARRLRAALRLADGARARYQRFFDEHPLPIWIYDNESLSIVAVNGAAQRTFGYQEAELLKMSLGDVHPADEFSRLSATRGRL